MCTNIRAKVFCYSLLRIVILIVIIISTRVVFLRKWRHILFSVWYIFSIETETHLRKRRNKIIQISANRPLPNYLNALYQSKSWCHPFTWKWDFIYTQIKLIFMWMVVQQPLFDREVQGNSEMGYYYQISKRLHGHDFLGPNLMNH